MSDYTQCPVCRSANTKRTKGEFAVLGFQAFGNRICELCGTAWRPSCPRWVAITCMLAGGVVCGSILVMVGFVVHQTAHFKTLTGRAGRNSVKFCEVLFTLLIFLVMGAQA